LDASLPREFWSKPVALKGTIPWNAGTGNGWTDKRGYRWIYVTENGGRRAKREHRHIMEQYLGRRLTPEEVVHHKNEDRSDNRIENLEIYSWGLHSSHHQTGARRNQYTKQTLSVIAEYREEIKRLNLLVLLAFWIRDIDTLQALGRLMSIR
jgi:hypothetical protein